MQRSNPVLTSGARWAAALALVLVMVVSGLGQSGRRPQPKQTPETEGEGQIELRTQEVLLAVTVRDVAGRVVTGLGPDEFIIVEDRERQEVESFSVASVPVNVVLVLDASGSVFSELSSIRRAAMAFIRELSPEDKVSIIQFADKVELLADWTSDHEELQHALDWRYRSGEATAFWDAVYLAADEQLAKVEGRRALIILSDGVDSKSQVGESQARRALDRAGASVYVVSKAQALIKKLSPYSGVGGRIAGTAGQARQIISVLSAAEQKMREMADRHGGRLYAPLSDSDLESAYSQVAREMKEQYVLTYVPTNDIRTGGWRTIEIFLTRPGVVAHTRKGYTAN